MKRKIGTYPVHLGLDHAGTPWSALQRDCCDVLDPVLYSRFAPPPLKPCMS